MSSILHQLPILTAADFVFYVLAATSLISAFIVITARNPIYCALALAGTMISVAGLFASMEAWFVAGVQLIVYAGAVMVLFVMVLMLFDLGSEARAFSRGFLASLVKLASVGLLCGMILGAIRFSGYGLFGAATGDSAATAGQLPETAAGTALNATDSTKALADLLFQKYVFSFEVMGVLLLIIAIGAVALSRIQGGTHEQSEVRGGRP